LQRLDGRPFHVHAITRDTEIIGARNQARPRLEVEGAVLAAVVYAFVHTFVTTFVDGVIADIVGLLLMLAVLIVRPTGLFGSRDRA